MFIELKEDQYYDTNGGEKFDMIMSKHNLEMQHFDYSVHRLWQRCIWYIPTLYHDNVVINS